MTEPRWYYNLNGNITDGKTIFETYTIPKKDINELFYNEIHKGSNSLLDLLNELSEENEQLKKDKVHLNVLLYSLQDRYSGLLKLVHGFDKND